MPVLETVAAVAQIIATAITVVRAVAAIRKRRKKKRRHVAGRNDTQTPFSDTIGINSSRNSEAYTNAVARNDDNHESHGIEPQPRCL
jgi:hypothetical protein